MRTGLELAHSYDADAGPFCEFLLAPIKEATSGSTLRGRDHLIRFAHATELLNSVEKRLTRRSIFYKHKQLFSIYEREIFVKILTCSIRPDRRGFIGGSDARIIMSPDEAALIRLWREKRGEVEPEDLSSNLVVQLGVATEALNQTWYGRNTGRVVTDIQRWVRHPVHRYLAATLDGFVNDLDAVFEAKFMLPWSFSEEGAAEKHMAQLQHNMWVTNARSAVLSIITGGGKWIEMTIPADALYQHFLVTAERRFWRCVQTGDTPRPYGIEPPRPRIEAVRIVDMSESNSWGEFAGLFCATRSAFLDHE
jgi:hypothetical protein